MKIRKSLDNCLTSAYRKGEAAYREFLDRNRACFPPELLMYFEFDVFSDGEVDAIAISRGRLTFHADCPNFIDREGNDMIGESVGFRVQFFGVHGLRLEEDGRNAGKYIYLASELGTLTDPREELSLTLELTGLNLAFFFQRCRIVPDNRRRLKRKLVSGQWRMHDGIQFLL